MYSTIMVLRGCLHVRSCTDMKIIPVQYHVIPIVSYQDELSMPRTGMKFRTDVMQTKTGPQLRARLNSYQYEIRTNIM